MLPLYQKVTRYLVRGGYRIEEAAPGFAIAEYGGDDLRDRPHRILLWVEDDKQAPSRELDAAGRSGRAEREDRLLREMIAEMQGTRDAVGLFVVPSRQGFSAEFIGGATDALQRGGRDKRGGVRTASEFFDADYKLDTRTGRSAKLSALGQLFDRVKTRRRVAQPYYRRTGLGPSDRKLADGDLVEHLDLVFRDPVNKATLRIIDGPAGGGKTVAFETLVVALYEEFIEAKKRQIERPRPIVFLPDHIRGQNVGGYVDQVIQAAMSAEAARPVDADQLRFLLTHGHAFWLFDGLDEFFGNDAQFFEYLSGELANPDSRAQVLICSRDSLLTSSTALGSFVVEQIAKGTAIEVYELAPWGPEAWRKLAWMELDAGLSGREESPKVEAFVKALSSSPELSQLATLPFYCTILLDEFRKVSTLPQEPLALLDTIIDRMLSREGDKQVFEWREFVDLGIIDDVGRAAEDLLGLSMEAGGDGRRVVEELLDKAGLENMREILGEIAHRRVRNARASGVDVDDIQDLVSSAYVDEDRGVSDADRLKTSIVQFAFFGAGKKAGAVDFSHPIVAEHLAALYALGLLRRAAEGTPSSGLSQSNFMRGTLRQAIGVQPLDLASVFARTLLRGITADPSIAAFVDRAASTLGRDDRKLAANVAVLRPQS